MKLLIFQIVYPAKLISWLPPPPSGTPHPRMLIENDPPVRSVKKKYQNNSDLNVPV